MRLALAALLLALAIPAAASAATAEVVAVQSRGTYYDVSYQAAPGEVNDLTLTGAGDEKVLTDSGAEIEPGEGCTTITAHSVMCTHEDLAGVDASLGDGEDRFTSEGPGFDVSGGPDDDVLDGGDSGGYLRGDDGADVLQGGKTTTWFYGGRGADTLVGTDQNDRLVGGPGADSIDGRGDSEVDWGGAGRLEDWSEGDVVSYEDHASPVTVDLTLPAGSSAGAAGEGDTLTSIESAVGGRGDDVLMARKQLLSDAFGSALTGGRGDDVLHGGPARDLLGGGGGDDSIRGGGADDQLYGGSGHDTLIGAGGMNELLSSDSGKPQRDSVRCGDAGFVTAGDADEPVLDVIDQSCGHVDLYGPIVGRVTYSYAGQPTRTVTSTVTCTRHCGITITLRAHGKVVGSATRQVRGAGSATLPIQLTPAARDELARAGVLKLGFSMDVSWGARLRHLQATSWQLLLHDPPPG